MAYVSSVHDSTGYSPSMMMLGREIELPVDILYGKTPEENETIAFPQYVENLQQRLWDVHNNAREQMIAASDKQKRKYDHRANQFHYDIGQAVWVRWKLKRRGISPKLDVRWEGPYLVVSQVSDLIYKVQKNPTSRIRTLHHDLLKPYQGEHYNWFRQPGENVQSLDEDIVDVADESLETLTVKEVPRISGRRKRQPHWMNDYTT
ncbi:uncharacterized protein LOC117335960 [Pecten maximus]|uniref:uncharacterized protein LOC117335960 n=1 Tax=Pecten maximus TaxID=6579 RepID=UPI00145804AA|nr:uncharacterized protein LOC117335960 [Pecten maximus]